MKAFTIIFLALLFGSYSAKAENAKITDLHVIELRDGSNSIPHFTPDGSDGLIVRAYRSNGNAHSYNIYMVMVHPNENQHTWMVVGTQLPSKHENLLDTLRDDPLSGENYAYSVWFAKGKLDGNDTSFLLTARRDISHGLYDVTPVEIQIFALTNTGESIGTTPFDFEQVDDRISTRKYQSSECALVNELNLPAPKDVESDCYTDGKQ